MTYSKKATCRFTVTDWKETVDVDIDGEGTTMGETYYPKRGLTRATVGFAYTGDVEGSSTMTFLIAYKDGAAPVLGMAQFTGSVDGQEGSCVFLQTGSQDAGSVSGRLEVVPGMGTGGLEGLRGEAEVALAGPSDDGYELVLSYDL